MDMSIKYLLKLKDLNPIVDFAQLPHVVIVANMSLMGVLHIQAGKRAIGPEFYTFYEEIIIIMI